MMSRRDNDQALKRLKARNETLQVRLMALDALLRHEQQLVTLLRNVQRADATQRDRMRAEADALRARVHSLEDAVADFAWLVRGESTRPGANRRVAQILERVRPHLDPRVQNELDGGDRVLRQHEEWTRA
jgi:hypothetical protein